MKKQQFHLYLTGDSSNVVPYLIVMLAATAFVVVAQIKTKFAK